jgi:uncharacterized protein (DUF885 family)
MGRNDAGIEQEIDRYIADPGQALGYKVGEIAIRRIREDAERRLGSAFDLRAFHDAVLESGPLPLDVLEEKMRSWTPPRAQGHAGVDRAQ